MSVGDRPGALDAGFVDECNGDCFTVRRIFHTVPLVGGNGILLLR
jgi:hypothetical protein